MPAAVAEPRATTLAPAQYTPRHLSERILAARDSLVGERKHVTVLFADIVGSTELIRDRDTEEAQQLLDGAVQVMMDAVHRYEGTVSRLMGDGLMALFGAPLAHEDHALRACYAALAMQTALRAYAEQTRQTHGVAIASRVGLNSGEVIVRLISDDLHVDYTAMGQTVHLAARMEQLAKADTAVLTPDTLALVGGYVDVQPLGPVPVKGLAEPMEVYQLVGAGAARTRLQAAASRGLTRFVGRDTELAVLRHALEQAQQGHGQVVALVGEPGVGKSRLVWEATHSLWATGWLVLESDSVSYGQATSYLPLIDLLKAYCHIGVADDVRVVREKVTSKVVTLDQALQPCLPPLLALLDVPVDDASWDLLDAAQRRRQTLNAVQSLLLRVSQEQPLLLVVEDLHWIDSETQAFLDGLVERLPAAQVLLLVTYRPEYSHVWGGKTFYSQLRIDSLEAASADDLLASLLGDHPSLQPLNRVLTAQTEGNPLFLEECVRTLRETGAVIGEPGSQRLLVPVPSLRVPATVQAVIAARIDRLSAEDKALLQMAAVIGKAVPDVLLRAIAGRDEDESQRGVAALQAAEFIYQARLFPEHVYTFKHALTHEVAYGSLLQERRKYLHTQVTLAIEQTYADRLEEHTELLAHHAARGEMWEKAANYAHQAGRRAADRSANRTAIHYFDLTLEALARGPDTPAARALGIDVRQGLHDALLPLAEIERLPRLHQEALALAESLGDSLRVSLFLSLSSNLHWRTGRYADAIEAARRGLALSTDLGDVTGQGVALHHLGHAYHYRGEWKDSVPILERGVRILDDAASRQRWGRETFILLHCLISLAYGLSEIGDLGHAALTGHQAVEWAERTGHAFTIERACASLAHVYLQQGDYRQAITILERARSLCDEHGHVVNLPWVLAELGTAYALRGSMDQALALAGETTALNAATAIVSGRSGILIRLAEIHQRAGLLDQAESLGRSAVTQADERDEPGYAAHAHRLLGDVLAQRAHTDLEHSLACYHRASLLADDLGLRPLQAHCHLGLGKVYRRVGRLDDAHDELTTAVTMLRDMGMSFWLPEAEAELEAVTIASPSA